MIAADGTRALQNSTPGEIMRVGTRTLKSVCFIGWHNPAEDPSVWDHVEGTGWFTPLTPWYWTIVTARHVLDQVPTGSKVRVWVNLASGLWPIDYERDDWETHEDPTVDLALLLKAINVGKGRLDLDHVCLSREGWVSELQLNHPEHPIGIGDRVYFPGLFAHHFGKERLQPIIRQGTVAAMNLEPVITEIGGKAVEIDAYLVEVHSIGGLSGSPVIMRFGFDHLNPEAPSPHDATKWPIFSDALFGVVHGHYDLTVPPEGGNRFERLNTGICMVVPIKYVAELLVQPKVVAMKEELEKESSQPLGRDASPDSVSATADLMREVLTVSKEEIEEVHKQHGQA